MPDRHACRFTVHQLIGGPRSSAGVGITAGERADQQPVGTAKAPALYRHPKQVIMLKASIWLTGVVALSLISAALGVWMIWTA